MSEPRGPHQSKYRGANTRQKPVMKNRNSRSKFAKQHLQLFQFWKNFLWTEETRVWRRKGQCSWSTVWPLLDLLMMWLLTRLAGGILKCFRQYYLLTFSHMLQSCLEDDSRCRWTITWSVLRKQPGSFLRQRSGMLHYDQVSHLSWIWWTMNSICWGQYSGENAPRTCRNWRQLQ